MKRVNGQRLGFAGLVLLAASAGAVVAGNVGPMMLQNLGSDIASADLATFRTNIGAQTALGYVPLNRAGDTATGLIGFLTSASATAAGTTQGTATQITAQTTIFTTVAANTGAVLNTALGVPQTVCNRGLNVLAVYPPTSAAIETNSTNAAVGVAVNGCATFRMNTSTTATAS